MAMNPEIKAKWVAALRSGEYVQGRGALRRDDNTYCCLGVLCDLHAKETGEPWERPPGDAYNYHAKGAYLPPLVVEWAGLYNSLGPSFEGVGVVDMNDGGDSFEKIADFIEQHA